MPWKNKLAQCGKNKNLPQECENCTRVKTWVAGEVSRELEIE